MTRRTLFAVGTASLCLALQCDVGDTAVSHNLQQFDSAGVRIVVTAASVWAKDPAQQWHASEPELVQVSESTAAELYPIADAILLDTRVVVASENGAVAVISADGSVSTWLGRPGAGPQGLNAPSTLHQMDSSLVVLDAGRRLVYIDSATGDHLSLVTLPQRVYSLSQSGQGWYAWTAPKKEFAHPSYPARSGFVRPARFLVRISGSGKIDTIGQFPGQYRRVVAGTGPPLLMLSTESVFTTRGDEIVVGTGDGHQLSVLSSSGKTIETYRWSGADLRVPESERNAWRRAFIETTRSIPPDPVRLAAIAKRFEFADRKGAYTRLLSDPANCIWVRHNELMTNPERYSILDREGVWLGDIVMPAKFRVLRAYDDVVLGVLTDSDGLEHIATVLLEK